MKFSVSHKPALDSDQKKVIGIIAVAALAVAGIYLLPEVVAFVIVVIIAVYLFVDFDAEVSVTKDEDEPTARVQ